MRVQLDVFDEQKASDEEQLPQSTTEGLDLSSHSDIFTAIIKQVGTLRVYYSLAELYINQSDWSISISIDLSPI